MTFFTDSQTKSMEISLEIAKLQACQCPEHLGDGHSLCLKTSFLPMPPNQCLSQQCLLSKVTEDHHMNKLVKKGTELIGSPVPSTDFSSQSTPLIPRVGISIRSSLTFLQVEEEEHRAGGDLLGH